MRMFKGKPFMDVSAGWMPQEDDGQGGKRPCYEGDGDLPVFSESFLYATVGKEDARFILGVAEEYAHIIEAMGTTAICRILDVKPRLARRLELAEAVTECLADANSTDFEYRQQQFPDITLDNESASLVWKMLHDSEYRRLYNPEKDMDRDRLRLYHRLTDELGHWEKEARQKEIDRLPEKLKKQEEKLANKLSRDQIRQGVADIIVNSSATKGQHEVGLTDDEVTAVTADRIINYLREQRR